METDNNNQTGQVPSTINALTPAEADALTTLSTLSKSVSRSSSGKKHFNEHTLGISSDDTYHEVKCLCSGKVRSGKRKRRGKCTEFGMNTQYYCIVFPPGAGHRHHWCCPDGSGNNKRMCHSQHKQKHNNED